MTVSRIAESMAYNDALLTGEQLSSIRDRLRYMPDAIRNVAILDLLIIGVPMHRILELRLQDVCGRKQVIEFADPGTHERRQVKLWRVIPELMESIMFQLAARRKSGAGNSDLLFVAGKNNQALWDAAFWKAMFEAARSCGISGTVTEFSLCYAAGFSCQCFKSDKELVLYTVLSSEFMKSLQALNLTGPAAGYLNDLRETCQKLILWVDDAKREDHE